MNGNVQHSEAGTLQRVGILGGGAWGTALAQSVLRAGRDVTLWALESETVSEINSHHTNRVYLPGAALDPAIKATSKVKDLADADLILLVVPSQFLRPVAMEIAPHFVAGTPVVICAKGFEENSGELMSEVVKEVLPGADVAVLSGPSFAGEVARNLPTALTLACENEARGARLMAALAHRTFRLYWSERCYRRPDRRRGQERAGDCDRHCRRPPTRPERARRGHNARVRGIGAARHDAWRTLRDADGAFGPWRLDPDMLEHSVAQHVAWHRAWAGASAGGHSRREEIDHGGRLLGKRRGRARQEALR